MLVHTNAFCTCVHLLCLDGKWGSGSYTTGRPSGGYYCSKTKNNCRDPSSWRSTTEIFDLYRDVLHAEYPVQYCQCFVYAGIVTTVSRALGIPARPVSTFQSAHDTDFNRAIEKYWIFDTESNVYEPTEGESTDSIWSFHVWNELYFKRTDFAQSSYNQAGWQAIDATPQELSSGGNPHTNDSVYQIDNYCLRTSWLVEFERFVEFGMARFDSVFEAKHLDSVSASHCRPNNTRAHPINRLNHQIQVQLNR